MTTVPRQATEDRRGSPRACLATSVVLHETSPLGIERITGRVVDLSPFGLSLELAAGPALGASLLIEVPGAWGDPRQQLSARVVRIEPLDGNRNHVACELSVELSRRAYRELRERLAVAAS